MVLCGVRMNLTVTAWVKRGVMVTMAATALVLAACGGGSKTVSALSPSRVIVFGDATADVGQNAGKVYSVNDGTNTPWVKAVAVSYGNTLTASVSGGQGWAVGDARVAAAGAALSVVQQIDAFFAAGNAIGANDLIIVSAGLTDITTQADLVAAGTITSAEGINQVKAAAVALGGQVTRLKDSGAKYISAVGVYSLSSSPYATATATLSNKSAFLASAASEFNTAYQIAMVQLGSVVLYTAPTWPSGFSDYITPVCTTASVLDCTTSTIISTIPVGLTYNSYAFADDRHLTPAGHAGFASAVVAKLRERF
jgi:outer membrane lipase/esterase